MQKLIVPRNQQSRFFFDPFHIWFPINVSCIMILQEHEIPWASVFGLIAWKKWKNINLYIFQNVYLPATEVIKTSLSWARQFVLSQINVTVNSMNPSPILGIEGQWVHLFIDGAVERDIGKAMVRGVIRYKDWKWILGFNHFLGMSIF